MLSYFDTSALLATNNIETLFGLHDTCYVAHNVIAELENIKNSANKSDEIKMRARRVARFLISHPLDYMCSNFPEKEIEKTRKKFCFPDNMDGRILAEAVCLARKNTVKLFTGDVNMFLFARECGELEVEFVEECCEEQTEVWSGWGKYYPTDEQLNQLYTDPTINILGAKINEYCEIYHEGAIKDVLRWDGKEYRKLKYNNFRSSLGQTIAPRNLEQKMVFDMLQNKDITVAMILGSFGTGKSMLALAHALHQVRQGEYDRIVFVRNSCEVANVERLGALPGNEVEKLYPFLMQIADHTSPEVLEDMLNQGIIEPLHLGYARGRDLQRCLVFADEIGQMTYQHLQLLIGRVGEGSKLILSGDIKQYDKEAFRKYSGIRRVSERLAGNPLFGCVKLVKTERSATASLADLID